MSASSVSIAVPGTGPLSGRRNSNSRMQEHELNISGQQMNSNNNNNNNNNSNSSHSKAGTKRDHRDPVATKRDAKRDPVGGTKDQVGEKKSMETNEYPKKETKEAYFPSWSGGGVAVPVASGSGDSDADGSCINAGVSRSVSDGTGTGTTDGNAIPPKASVAVPRLVQSAVGHPSTKAVSQSVELRSSSGKLGSSSSPYSNPSSNSSVTTAMTTMTMADRPRLRPRSEQTQPEPDVVLDPMAVSLTAPPSPAIQPPSGLDKSKLRSLKSSGTFRRRTASNASNGSGSPGRSVLNKSGPLRQNSSFCHGFR